MNLLPPQAPEDKDPMARVRRELALWASPRMQEVREVIKQAAHVDVTVLITGETGIGKELVARAIHYLGARRDGPFVKVNCAAVARELLESELFGHKRGAFTGAHQLKIGKFEAANQGTIFLDEIERLTWHDFPGNVRELENTIKRMIVLGDPRLGAPARQTANGEYEAAPASKAVPGSLRDISRKAALAAERSAILKALDETRWNRVRAAKLPDISYRSLLYKIKDADLDGKRRNSLHP